MSRNWPLNYARPAFTRRTPTIGRIAGDALVVEDDACGWDYIFSFIKKFRRHFLNSYVQLLIETCHRRGIHAMGGMAAQIPIKSDPPANEQALEKVRQDKLREVRAGHDGTWVAHPGLVPVAKAIFDQHMPEQNQIARKRGAVNGLQLPGLTLRFVANGGPGAFVYSVTYAATGSTLLLACTVSESGICGGGGSVAGARHRG